MPKPSKPTGITAESGAFEARHKQMLATMRRIGNGAAHSPMKLRREDGRAYAVTAESGAEAKNSATPSEPVATKP
jgi:hypothetical protein